ncbi:MAG: pentapeptide repeat-containing protein [Clostridia bacterium]|nr:pentapeptide repeat-containing protein [Clostridia bacterium]
MGEKVRGYKVFYPDWKCRGFQYAVGECFEMEAKPIICNRGFHFCKELADCFSYYPFDPKNKVAEVEAYGDVVENEDDGSKCCTNKISIVRELSWEEVLRLVNIGKGNSGLRNSGDWNSGNRNSGNRNSGDWNSGDWNSGDWNSGDWNSGNGNSGDWNSGNRNSGDWNSGDWNSGDWNSGDWNSTCFSNGCFNTEEPKIYMFNKPSEWTYRDWLDSAARRLLERIDYRILEWVFYSEMTDEEKAAHPKAKTTNGYLKSVDTTGCAKLWWDGLRPSEKDIIRSIPNFDPAVFKEIVGVDVTE